ncbi:hypothetical protein MX824_004908 [Vibrio parahaemolyticus]|nr:hypothetical protein [Vibrio parahaemolyticus]EJC6784200.1 hypothetical protein [Vibrio parahaemolyticus]EJC6813376.1 hypothetical protein [Vibrio parahaemolyticus]EJC6928011.1 hypothetical protein [Vibrio parahaemolyticus]EJC6942329.1 hypothetical protein [Vibrio parahaemolyticus]
MTDWKVKLVEMKSNLAWLFSYTLPIKVIFGFLLTALGSASVLGLLSEFAVYNYALVNGFRVPVEGIPYLKPTVTLISLVAIGVALLGFVTTYLFTKFTALFMYAPDKFMSLALSYFNIKQSSISKVVIFNDMRGSSLYKALFISVLSSLTVTLLVLLNFKGSEVSDLSLLEVLQNPERQIFSNPVLDALFVFTLTFVMYFSAFRPKWIKHIALSIALISTVSVLVFMFNTNMYSAFLHATGFGGERPVTLFTGENETVISGKLLIQSNDYYIILNKDLDVVEYPVQSVSKVQYKQTKHTLL